MTTTFKKKKKDIILYELHHCYKRIIFSLVTDYKSYHCNYLCREKKEEHQQSTANQNSSSQMHQWRWNHFNDEPDGKSKVS